MELVQILSAPRGKSLREKEARGSAEDNDRVPVLAEFLRFGSDGFLLIDMDQPKLASNGLAGVCSGAASLASAIPPKTFRTSPVSCSFAISLRMVAGDAPSISVRSLTVANWRLLRISTIFSSALTRSSSRSWHIFALTLAT